MTDRHNECLHASHQFLEEYSLPVKYYHSNIKTEKYFSFYSELPNYLKSALTSNFHSSCSPEYPPEGAFIFVRNKTFHFQKLYTTCSDRSEDAGINSPYANQPFRKQNPDFRHPVQVLNKSEHIPSIKETLCSKRIPISLSTSLQKCLAGVSLLYSCIKCTAL